VRKIGELSAEGEGEVLSFLRGLLRIPTENPPSELREACIVCYKCDSKT